ncbi:hypothetical protein B0H17DRAFT_1159076 [Mycena rosella]|uniref:CxC5 like cysteine cluster associated with KDZ domain-containing protein n=1 Tax=Mycena rosella TaxID=1033263 RepID=A0AAD7DMG5_MYCRO|nr:hypothetical protein B0H17DRAFT_1159076 [Mycena rosella]
MIPTVGHLILILQLYFIEQFSLQRSLYIITVLTATYPLFRLHLNQRRAPRQPMETAWLRSIATVLGNAFANENEHPHFPPDEEGLGPQLSQRVCADLEQLYHLLGADDPSQSTELFPPPHIILCTTRLHCIHCPAEDGPPPLSRHEKPQQVKLLNSDFRWVKAQLFVAYCIKCRAEYYPDRFTYKLEDGSYGRVQSLEYDACYLRHGIWVHRRIAMTQENAILRFKSGWSNFAEWLSDTIGALPRITTRQSQRLYFEHFARRLITLHGLEATFTIPAHSSSQVLAESVRNIIGRDGGVVAGSMDHGCINCTHIKRYTSDLIAEGAVLNGDETGGVVDGGDNSNTESEATGLATDPSQIPPGLVAKPTQQIRRAGTGQGYTRMAVMDGKSISHRICALSTCKGALVNYKNGRFCRDHLEMRNICGIIPCGRQIHSEGALTCADPFHKDWHTKYLNRFSRLSFPGVQRVVRQQKHSRGPTPHSELPDLSGTSGDQVVHTFRARTTYCLQTVQWSCGCPIGWGKCYNSESSSQVLAIIDRIWEFNPDSKPSFIAYDDACNLLRHVVTQDPDSPWLKSTKFIVDAWHYIGHRATNILCRIWCNPAPTNGSQPDLIAIRTDDNGQQHTTRTFNTETAEQLNAWLNGYEAQLRQMSDTNYDFFVHVLMLLYKQLVDKRVAKNAQYLSEEFWEKVVDLE